jgi:hypothetical protein
MSGPITIGNDWLNATELQREALANQYYNDLLSGHKWTTSTLTWSAPTSSYGFFANGATPQGFVQFSAQDIQETQYFLNYLSSIVNLHFTYASSGSSDIKLGYDHLTAGVGGYAYYPPTGVGYISSNYAGGSFESPGSNGFLTLIHEFGHLLGLKHPFDAPVLPKSLDTTYATVESYNQFSFLFGSSANSSQSYMPLDIAALLSMYGSAVGIPTTNFTFQFSATAAFTYGSQNATVNIFAPFYLYDANHSVTLDFSTLNNSSDYLTIDLKDLAILYAPQGGLAYVQYNDLTSTWSDIQHTNATTQIFNTSISSNTHITSIIGSPLNDTIVAGTSNCFINGGAGTDTLVYNDSFANCTLTINSGQSFTIADNSHLLGTDTATNVEKIQFTDQLFSLQITPTIIQNDYLAITRTALPLDQATTIANAINAGTQTETQYVNSLLLQVANTTIPAVAVEASMYNATGTSAEVTSLTVNFLPPQIANATHWGLNAQVYACEALGLVFAFANETGSTAFSNNFGPLNSAMPNTAAGDEAFASAASNTIFGAASTANLVSVLQGYVSFWETFYAAHGVPGLSSASAAQIDLAARGAAWGDMVGVALANNLGPVNGQTINFLDDAAQGSAIYGASLVGQPAHHPFFS